MRNNFSGEDKTSEEERNNILISARLSSTLHTTILAALSDLSTENKFRIGIITLAKLLSDFCYCIIKVEHSEKSLELLNEISNLAHMILHDKYIHKENKSNVSLQ